MHTFSMMSNGPFPSLNECKPILAAARASDVCSDRMLSVLGPCESSPGLLS